MNGSASAPKRTRGLVSGRKVEKMCKSMRSRIPMNFDDFTKGVSGKKLSSLTAAQIGKIVRGSVRMMAPNWESLEDGEKFKVVLELSLHTLIWRNGGRCRMPLIRRHQMYTRDGSAPCTNSTGSTAALLSLRSSNAGRASEIG